MYSIELPHLFYGKKEVSRGSKHIRFYQTLLRFARGLDLRYRAWGGTPDLSEVVFVPLMMVHPVLTECVMVVRPSWVITEDPSIFSRQSSDFCCSWIHPKSFSPFGQG